MSRKAEFTKLGFTEYESINLSIMMSLKTPGEMQEWAQAVGREDVAHGLHLLRMAAELQEWDDIDNAEIEDFSLANEVINMVK